MGSPPSERDRQRRYRAAVASLLIFAVLVLAASTTLYRGVHTLRRLEVVEAERDRWQRPADVVRVLDLENSAAVADVGCGAGYFALKLSRSVGLQGKVLAVDIRWLPLLFLEARALLQNRHNVTVVRGDAKDPHLRAGAMDAVLIANTYHELTDPEAMLGNVFKSLRAGGRLVIVDPHPEAANGREDHAYAEPGAAEIRLRQVGFELVSRDDRFIDQPPDRCWWLIVARKPGLVFTGP